MPRPDDSRDELVAALLEHRGPVPARGAGPLAVAPASPSTFASIALAAIDEVAEPKVALAAFEALRGADLLTADRLAKADEAEVDEVLKLAKVKVAARSLRPLRKLAAWFVASEGEGPEDEADPDSLTRRSTEALRDAWRSINGVGPATADAWLLFGLGRATFPVDRGTYRVLVRHGWLDTSADYDEARSAAESILGFADRSAGEARELKRKVEGIAREFCKPAAPRCDRCPLGPWLPAGGPVDPDG